MDFVVNLEKSRKYFLVAIFQNAKMNLFTLDSAGDAPRLVGGGRSQVFRSSQMDLITSQVPLEASGRSPGDPTTSGRKIENVSSWKIQKFQARFPTFT